MAALQQQQQRRQAISVHDEPEPEDRQLDQANSSIERAWTIFEPQAISSPSLDSGTSLEAASLSSEGSQWQGIGDGLSRTQMPAHDGSGVFKMDDSDMEPSLYASAHPEWAHIRAATSSDSARLSFSESSGGADVFRDSGAVPRPHPHSASRVFPLTEHALAHVPDHRPRRADGDEEAVLTASSDNEQLSDVEELLSRTPQAASAGIQRTPRARRKADHAGLKRRHRTSGLSDKGSKRSNASSGPLALATASTSAAANAHPERRKSDPAKGFLLGNVVRKVFSVDQDLLDMVATSPPLSLEKDSVPFPSVPISLPRAPVRSSRFRRRMTLGSEVGMTAFTKHLRDELGDFSGYAAGMTDSGEETEMEPSFTPRPGRSSASRDSQLIRASEASPARSMSLSSLPQLWESAYSYSSLPTELWRSTSPAAIAAPMQRAASLNEARSAAISPVEPVRISYWRILLQRFRLGIENAL